MIPVDRLQAYFRAAAKAQYDCLPGDPFDAFLHPTDPLPYYNYAIPRRPLEGDLSAELDRLRPLFAGRGRALRFEFVEAFAPALAASLEEGGLTLESRAWLMVLPKGAARPVPPPAGAILEPCGADADDDTVRAFVGVARRAFGMPDDGVVPADELASTRASFGRGAGILARVDGAPAGVASLLPLLGGLAEVAGVGTRPEFRGRGLGGAVTAAAAAIAVARGAEAVVLSAGSAEAGRVYERVGFAPSGHTLAYGDARR